MALTYSRSLLEERSQDHCIMLLASPPQAPALMTRPLRTSSLCFLLSHKQAPGFLDLPHICQNMVALPVSPPHSNFQRQSLCQMQIQDSHHHVLFWHMNPCSWWIPIPPTVHMDLTPSRLRGSIYIDACCFLLLEATETSHLGRTSLRVFARKYHSCLSKLPIQGCAHSWSPMVDLPISSTLSVSCRAYL